MTPEQIAASLTKAQASAIMSSEYDGEHWLMAEAWAVYEGEGLKSLKLAGQDDWTDALTPLGLAVRKILKERNDD